VRRRFANPHRTGATDRPAGTGTVTARRDLDTQAALAAKASEEVARTRQTAERDSTSLRSSYSRSGLGPNSLSGISACETGCTKCRDGWLDRGDKPTKTRSQSATVTGGGLRAMPSQFQESRGGGSVTCACERAARAGDIGGARIVLERAVEMVASRQASRSQKPMIR